MDYEKLANLLLSNVDKTTDYYEKMFPKRNLEPNAKVTRLGPSPTGFIHIGNLYGAFIDERLAKQSNGSFYLRIEDTDEKRYVEGAVDVIVNSLKYFGINFDEGVTSDGQLGEYGDYYQSNRADIYQCFVKYLVSLGLAYPCFLTTEELEEIHSKQEELKENFGIYGKWAINRNLSYEEIETRISRGEKYVIRLKSGGNLDVPKEQIRYIEIEDGVRRKIRIPENNQDVVILKQSGIPTYHFAHVVDDHLMRTTHVVRGEEWLSSLPIHVELFEKLGFEIPVYCHTAHLMKIDEDGNKRKLSKRKDPELSLDYYMLDGYHPDAVKEYLMTITNSNFEEWRIANPDASLEDFKFSLEKMSPSGALFDLNKLADISKNVFSKMSEEQIYDFLVKWANFADKDVLKIIEQDKDYVCKILSIGRHIDKPRKDFIYAKQIFNFIKYFFDETFVITDELPSNVSKSDGTKILSEYKERYDHSLDQTEWFGLVKSIAVENGYAEKPKDFKKNPELYKGHVGDIAAIIRIALTGKQQSPDVWEIQQTMGSEKTNERIRNLINVINLPKGE